jgi:hypothetical protein
LHDLDTAQSHLIVKCANELKVDHQNNKSLFLEYGRKYIENLDKIIISISDVETKTVLVTAKFY